MASFFGGSSEINSLTLDSIRKLSRDHQEHIHALQDFFRNYKREETRYRSSARNDFFLMAVEKDRDIPGITIVPGVAGYSLGVGKANLIKIIGRPTLRDLNLEPYIAEIVNMDFVIANTSPFPVLRTSTVMTHFDYRSGIFFIVPSFENHPYGFAHQIYFEVASDFDEGNQFAQATVVEYYQGFNPVHATLGPFPTPQWLVLNPICRKDDTVRMFKGTAGARGFATLNEKISFVTLGEKHWGEYTITQMCCDE